MKILSLLRSYYPIILYCRGVTNHVIWQQPIRTVGLSGRFQRNSLTQLIKFFIWWEMSVCYPPKNKLKFQSANFSFHDPPVSIILLKLVYLQFNLMFNVSPTKITDILRIHTNLPKENTIEEWKKIFFLAKLMIYQKN